MAQNAFVFLFLGLTLLQRAYGEGHIEIKFVYYQSDCGDCDPMFTFCVDRPGPHKSVNKRDCSYGHAGESGHYHDTGRVDFGSSIKGITNPWKVRFGRLHESSIMLVARVRDDDIFGADHMATWGGTYTETVYPTAQEARYQTKRMRSGNHVLEFQIKIYCIEDYYGWNCGTRCIPQDNANGHYSCDRSNGNRICHEGWTGSLCNEDKDECALGYCQHGTCKNLDGDYYCHCDENYSGRNCAILGDPCETVPCQNNGLCIAVENEYNHLCNCSDPWTGPDCGERISPCVSEPCLNDGECLSNEDNTNFTCDCKTMFEGPFCETTISTTTATTITTTITTTGANESTTAFIDLGDQRGPARVRGDSPQGFPFWAGILIGLVLLIIIAVILLLFIRRRGRKRKEQAATGLPDNVVHFNGNHLAFENNMYSGAANRGGAASNSNGAIRPQPPLPATPTDDDLKPKLVTFNETPGAVGGFDPNDGGYMKPSEMEDALKEQAATPSDSQRAQNNPYSDFRDVKGSQHGEREHAEPHYQDLDEVVHAFSGLDGETRDDVSLVFDEPSFDHGHSPRTTAKLKAMAGQALEFNNQIYVSSSSSSVSEDDDFGEPKHDSGYAQPHENQYSEPSMSASSMPGNFNLAATGKKESQYCDVPCNAPAPDYTATPPLQLNMGDGAYSQIGDETESDTVLAQRMTARRQNKNENPYAEPAIPAPPLVESSPSDIPQFEDQPYADVHPPVRRDRSNQLGEDHMHDDEDDIPNFGLPHGEAGYAFPPPAFRESPKEPLYADPNEPEKLAPVGSNEYASPRSSGESPVEFPKSQDPETSRSRPSAYEEIDPTQGSKTPDLPPSVETDGNSSELPKLPTLFLENHAFERDA